MWASALGICACGASLLAGELLTRPTSHTQRLPAIQESEADESAQAAQRKQAVSSRRMARLPALTPPEQELQHQLPPSATDVAAEEPPLPETLDVPTGESLHEAWQIALQTDPWLSSKRALVGAAEANLLAAQAERMPWLDGGASYTVRDNQVGFVFQSPEIPGTLVLPYQQREGAGYSATAGIPLYAGGGITAAIDAAAASTSATNLEAEVARLDLQLRVAEEYVQVLRAGSDVVVTRATARSLESHARDVEMLYAHDRRPRHDLLAAQVALADARQATIVAENAFDVACAAYNRRLGRPLSTAVQLRDLPVRSVTDDVDHLTQEALSNRQELAQLAAQAQALSYQAESILARNRPQAALNGGYVFNENRYQTPEGIAAVGVNVSWNLYDGGRDRHRACALQQQAAALHRLHSDLEARIRLDVHRVWLDVQETSRRLTVTRAALVQADENVRVTRGRYTHEMGTNTDVLSAESLRVQSYRNHHHAYYDAVLAYLRLQRVLSNFSDSF